MKQLRRCKFSEKYLATYRSDDLRKEAAKKRGMGKAAESKRTLLRVKWDKQQQTVTYHKDNIDFLD